MNRKIYTSILAFVTILLAFSFLTGCSSSKTTPPPPVIAIMTAAGSTPQTQTITEAFPIALGVNVTSNGTAASGVTVTFSAPSSNQSCTLSATTATTDANGNASVNCTANGTAGAYTVTATATGATAPASFNLTNAPPAVFTFYLSGLEAPSTNNGAEEGLYYAIAGAVAFDLSGNPFSVLNDGNCGEQDYNDGIAITSAEPTGDTISATGTSLTVNRTSGLGTLVLATSNKYTGPVATPGVETFAVQFINQNRALITQFDGSATSSGSMDLQSPTTENNFAFTISGTDSYYGLVGYGGVFTTGKGNLTGIADVNDEGKIAPGTALSGSVVSKADPYGRGTASLTINGVTLSLVYYDVTAEVLRLIDVDVADGSGMTGSAALGSAYGLGATPAFDTTALGAANVFALEGNSQGPYNAAAGNIVPSGSGTGVYTANFSGEGDINENETVVSASPISGTYQFDSSGDGYGSLTITNEGLEDVSAFGLYATLSSINLMDPNNTSGGGGALLLDLVFPGDTGVVVPQATTLAITDLNNSYGFGGQIYFSGIGGLEFDYVAQGGFDSTGDLTGTGELNDPYDEFSSTPTQYASVTFAGTAAGPDKYGLYTMVPYDITAVSGTAVPFTLGMYEASSALVFTVDEDTYAVGLGIFQEQSASSLAELRFRTSPKKAQVKRKH